MSKRSGPNKDNLEETRRIFINVAREEFCQNGYPNASTSRIVLNSNMARGSLYYHFGDKNGLFRAVYEDVLLNSMTSMEQEMKKHKDPWDALMAGSKAFLELCADAHFRKIILIESQSALTYAERHALQSRTLFGKLRAVLPELMERGYFSGHTLDTIFVFILGILAEIGRSFDLDPNNVGNKSLYESAYRITMDKFRPETLCG
jgi:AcrR family transcriptional regulator